MSRAPAPPAVHLLGLPTDEASSFARGTADAPLAIRTALYSGSSNLTTEDGRDLALEPRFVDAGDLALPGGAGTRAAIERDAGERLDAGARLLCLGGDHAVSYPLVRAHARRHERLTLVQVDAHPDLYDTFEGDRFSHACVFSRVMEEGLVRRLVQIGIRAATPGQLARAERLGVEIVPRRRWLDVAALDLEPPLYLSLDLDGLDPAFAPGVSHPEGGGLATREVLEIVRAAPGPVGADLVELNPSRDPSGITAAAAAKLVKELAGRLLEDTGAGAP